VNNTPKHNVAERFASFCIRWRWAVVTVLAFCTLLFAYSAAQIQVKTVFTDMLPLGNPWVKINEQYKTTFGGANMVTIMIDAEGGTIFQRDILDTVQKVTQDLRKVGGIDSASITSLAARQIQTVEATSSSVDTISLMWPNVPQTQAQVDLLKKRVLATPLVYGRYVSKDLSSALVTADFIDRLVDYKAIAPQINQILEQDANPHVKMYVVGQPMLVGWVRHYLPQTLMLALITIALLAGLLFLLTRSYRGTGFPLIAGGVGAIWALGIAHLLGFNFDPLVIVVALLITARAISHSVQLVTRFDDLTAKYPDMSAVEAARRSLRELLRPGSVGVLADAGAMLVVLLTPIPLLQKVAIIGAVWVGTIFISAVVLTPVLLSWLKSTNCHAHGLDLGPLMYRVLEGCVRLSTGKLRYVVVAGAGALFIASGVLALHVSVGDVHPGSPVLRQGSTYNQASAKINARFPGANRMFVVVHGDKPGVIKDPDVLNTMALFQRTMAIQPEIGGTESIVDVIESTNQFLHGNDPRYFTVGNSSTQNAQFLYLFFSNSTRSAIERYADTDYQNAAINLSFHDHTGDTIRTAIHTIQGFMADHPMQHATFQLAGGLIGVMAAVNDVLLRGQMEAIALGLLVVVLCAMVLYRSTVAGMFFMVPVLLSNTVTFAFMSLMDIGLNINTVPVVALGIGLGVDYSFYIADGIREEVILHGDKKLALRDSLHSAGRGVLVTGLTLVATVVVWMFSALKFQSEMGELIAVWLTVSATSAVVVMPALAYIFKPRFIFGVNDDLQESTRDALGTRGPAVHAGM